MKPKHLVILSRERERSKIFFNEPHERRSPDYLGNGCVLMPHTVPGTQSKLIIIQE